MILAGLDKGRSISRKFSDVCLFFYARSAIDSGNSFPQILDNKLSILGQGEACGGDSQY